jgi:hypothetical protein
LLGSIAIEETRGGLSRHLQKGLGVATSARDEFIIFGVIRGAIDGQLLVLKHRWLTDASVSVALALVRYALTSVRVFYVDVVGYI